MLGYLARRAIPGVEVVAGGTYRRTVVVDGAPGVIEVARGGDDHLLLWARLPHRAALAEAARRVRRIFGLDTDLEAAGAALAGDPVIGPLLAARPGLRVPGTWDPYEIGVRAIIGQQVTVAGASTLAGRLVERHGTRVPGPEARLTHAFPPPSTLAGADLGGIGLTGTRMRAIGAFAAAVAADRMRLDASVPLDQLVGAIAGVPGVGPWTAQYVALRMGQPDALPASDLGLRRALADPDAGPVLPSAAEVTVRAGAWRPWRALAAVHLWTSGHATAPA
jgi:AraC family transcriptional regulator, regulatory protein of adaptative response / DNA-3-methyladenine glycosylase II